jgi:nitrogenase iron protein NifH
VAVKSVPDGGEGAPILVIPADGDITGDYMQGILDAMRTVAEAWIDPHVEPESDTVNVIAEKNLALNTDANFETVSGLLGSLGLRVNCRFIRRCSMPGIVGFKRGRLNLQIGRAHV